MSPDFYDKWEHILQDVEKSKIPVEFIKKIVIKLEDKKQTTINIKKLLDQGLDSVEIEELVSQRLDELDPVIVSLEFVLNLETIAEIVQPETDKLLNRL